MRPHEQTQAGERRQVRADGHFGDAKEVAQLRNPGVAALVDPWDRNPILERLEENRVRQLAERHARSVELWRLQAQVSKQRRVLERLLESSAFRLAERWKRNLGEAALRDWEENDREIDDYVTKQKTRIHFELFRELDKLDRGWPDVRVPVLIIHGRGDDTVPIEGSREWARDRRWVRLVEVDDGHELVASLPTIIEETEAFLKPFLR